MIIGGTTILMAQQDSIELRKEAPNIFIDCAYCDIAYFKKNIQMINYVRELRDADVYVQFTSQGSGSGGEVYEIHFEGRKAFLNQNHLLKISIPINASNYEQRTIFIKNLKAGLLPYIAQTPIFAQINLSNIDVQTIETTDTVEDKWNYWVYSVGLDGSISGEDAYRFLDASVNLTADRVTEQWKHSFGLNNVYSQNKYFFGTEEITLKTESFNLRGFSVKSINDHWSVGGAFSLYSNTFSNIKASYAVAPALEYSLFPYEEAFTKQLIFSYKINTAYQVYRDSTIFDKTKELLFQQDLLISYDQQASWGYWTASLEGASYLHDFSLYNLRFSTSLNLRLARGLSLNLFGNIALVLDQISLSKEVASLEETLLQIREISKNYRYNVRIGINYTFGSIYSNVVNPRFDKTF